MGSFEPKDSARKHPEGAVALGALVVAGGKTATLLAAANQALDAVALAVHRPVEAPAAALVVPAGDGVADASAPAVRPMRPAGVAFVAHDAHGTQPRPPATGTPHRPLLQQPGEDGCFVPLPRRQ